MCGITAYAGTSPALPFLLQGLEKLEYRGYDSAGVTLVNRRELLTIKAKGRLDELKTILSQHKYPETTGIGHTRWATHGIPSNLNSHPHTNQSGTISIVHNGIIENFAVIREFLESCGYTFASQTDSEVIVHMLDYYYHGDLLEALKKTVNYLEGSFALCAVCKDDPHTVYTACRESPMVLGKTEEAAFCASDIPAVLQYTKEVIAMEDGQIAVLRPGSIEVLDFDGNPVNPNWTTIQYSIEAAQKGGYDTFMEKEMKEQPEAVLETLRGRISDGVVIPELDQIPAESIQNVYFIACGTAWHACLHAASLLRKWTELNAQAVPASEFRYGDWPLDPAHTLCVFVSQSGETADTLAALKLAKAEGVFCISLSNVLDSSLSRQSDAALYTCAGPEISVASTKAYTTQLVMLTLIDLKLAQLLDKAPDNQEALLADLERMPEILKEALALEKETAPYAKLLKDKSEAYFIGRQLDHSSVLEGALKLKEVSYIHADAYYAGELKHGPIALIEDGAFVLALATQPDVASKTMSNIQETIARGANVLLVTSHELPAEGFEQVIRLPQVEPELAAVPAALLMQSLALQAATAKGRDVDKPRNLAKSVTVE